MSSCTWGAVTFSNKSWHVLLCQAEVLIKLVIVPSPLSPDWKHSYLAMEYTLIQVYTDMEYSHSVQRNIYFQAVAPLIQFLSLRMSQITSYTDISLPW